MGNEDKDVEIANHLQGGKTTEERYRRMVDEVQDYAILLLDEKGHIQNWNRGAEAIKLYAAAEIVGKHFSIFYLPDDQKSGLPERLLSTARLEGRAVHEGWRIRKDGTRFWGSISLTALHGDNGEIIGFSKVTRDLTEKKIAEDYLRDLAAELQLKNDALRASEERYHAMISEVQDYAILLLDTDGHIINWNKGAEHIKGYCAEEIVGQHFKVFYSQSDQDEMLPHQLLATASLRGRALHEGWRIKKNGTRFWGSIVITALHNSMGELIGFSKVTRDLTQKKEAEDQLQEHVLMLERRNEELDRFAYTASHDLQEPLRKIQVYTDLIQQQPDNPDIVKQYLEKIMLSSQRMGELVRSILDYSRLANTQSNIEETDFNKTFAEVLQDFELLIQKQNATIHLNGLPTCHSIPSQIHQLFANLLSNSLKYSEAVPVIEVNTDKILGKDDVAIPPLYHDSYYYRISFRDNGIGFDSSFSELIFVIFQRLHARHKYTGTGIGLALCKKIMDNHNGFIRAESEVGKGSTFFLYFPAS